jgi:hypothetical protein
MSTIRCDTISGAPGTRTPASISYLSLVMLRYVDEAVLSPFWKWLARAGAPIAAILIPAAFFLSVASPTAQRPNGLMSLAYIGALFLAAAVLSLGVGLIRAARRMP